MKLARHRDRPDWRTESPSFLLGRLRGEVDELEAALANGLDPWEEAADVANLAAMLADHAAPAVR